MDSNNFYFDQNKNTPTPGEPFTDSFAIASLCLGILSIPALCCTYLGLIFGVLAIVFAFISKKKNGKMLGVAVAGMTIGIVTSILAILLIIVGLVMMQNSTYQQMYNEILNEYQNFKSNSI